MVGGELQAREFSARDVERALIDDHWQYGGLIHQSVAEWLVSALAAERDPVTRHVLFSRLFGEFAASLETYAAWAWALRSRFDSTFLDAYLNYSNRDVGDFYTYVRDHEADLSDLLRLPPADRIVEIAVGRGGDLPEQGYHDSLDAQYRRLKEAAGMYFQTDRVIVDAYNKTKHGAPMIRCSSQTIPRRSSSFSGTPAERERPPRIASRPSSLTKRALKSRGTTSTS
jgi:hypothetical protein